MAYTKAIKNPSPLIAEMGSGYDEKLKAKRPAHSLSETPPPVLRRMRAVDMAPVSPLVQASVNCASAGPEVYFFAPLCRFFLYLRVNSTNRGVRPTSS